MKSKGIISILATICILAMCICMHTEATNYGAIASNTTEQNYEIVNYTELNLGPKNICNVGRQEFLNLLLEQHPTGSMWICPDSQSMAKIQDWLKKEIPDEKLENICFYDFENGYSLSLTEKRTLKLFNKDGWTLESFNVDVPYELMQEAVAGSGATYLLQEGNLVSYKLGEKSIIASNLEANYIFGTENAEVVFLQNKSNLSVVYENKIINVSSNYGYGVKFYWKKENVMCFEFKNTDGNDESVIINVNTDRQDENSNVIYIVA